MSAKEAAKALGVIDQTIQRHCLSGRLYADKRGRDWWIDKDSVDDLKRPGARHAGGRPRKHGAAA